LERHGQPYGVQAHSVQPMPWTSKSLEGGEHLGGLGSSGADGLRRRHAEADHRFELHGWIDVPGEAPDVGAEDNAYVGFERALKCLLADLNHLGPDAAASFGDVLADKQRRLEEDSLLLHHLEIFV